MTHQRNLAATDSRRRARYRTATAAGLLLVGLGAAGPGQGRGTDHLCQPEPGQRGLLRQGRPPVP